jgi:putative MATE family efflux protein
MIFGVIGMQAFNLVDTFFVGKLGVHELAAMSFTFPVVLTVGGIALGLGLGASAVISRAIGEGDRHRVRRLTTDSLTLSVLIVALFVAAGLLSIGPVFRLLGASEDLLPLVRQYMTVWYPGMLFVVVPMVGNNAIRATGDTKTPGVIMLIAAVANGCLDPLFIFGIGPFPRLELAGAALATVIGRSITFTVALWVLGRRDRMLTREWPGFAAVWESWRGILYIGLPSALTNIAVPLGVGFITRIVSGYGAAAVAGFGVASRVETFSFTFVMALRSVVAPFVGQNWGAGEFPRLVRGIRLSHAFAMAWGGLMLVLLGAFARPVASVFNSAPEVVATTALYLWIVPLSYGLRGVHFVATAALSVLRRPIDAAALTVLQFFGLYFPLALIGSHLLGLRGVFGAASIANLIAGTLAYLWLRRIIAMRAGNP